MEAPSSEASVDSATHCSFCDAPLAPPNKRKECFKCGTCCGCDENACWVDQDGIHCGACGTFWCDSCSKVESCGVCLELYCRDCGDFKPGKGGIQECGGCQPWYKRRKSALDYCSECGSTRRGRICFGCNAKFCHECPGFPCSGPDCFSGVFYCEGCNAMRACDKCEELFCENCMSEHEDVDC